MTAPDREILREVVEQVVASGEFILRGRCAELERRMADRLGFGHAVATASPQAGLLLVLTALRLRGCATGITVRADAPAYTAGVLARCGIARVFDRAPVQVVGGLDSEQVSVRGTDVPGQEIQIVDLGPGTAAGGIATAAMIFTRDAGMDRDLRMLRNHGQDGHQRFVHHVVGFNARMDEICAGYLMAKPGMETGRG